MPNVSPYELAMVAVAIARLHIPTDAEPTSQAIDDAVTDGLIAAKQLLGNIENAMERAKQK